MLPVIRHALFICLGLVGFGFGASGARAQTYDFTFTGSGGQSITNGIINVASGSVTSISGTASGLSAEGLNDGAFSFLSPVNYNFSYASPTNYAVLACSSIACDSNISGTVFNLESGGFANSVRNPAAGGASVSGTSTLVQATPAPEAATGALSFLILGLAGLWHKRRELLTFVRERRLKIA